MTIDLEALKRDTDMVRYIGQYVDLKPKGPHYMGLCPFHADKTPSLVVTPGKGLYKCFACGASGDVLKFVEDYHKLDFRAAIAHLQGGEYKPSAGAALQRLVNKSTEPEWQPIVPVPAGAPAPKLYHARHGEPARKWTYTTAQGETIGHILRYNTPTGKEIIPLTYCQRGEQRAWQFKGFPTPRPLLHLHVIAAFGTAGLSEVPIILTEGEKAAEAVHKRLAPGWLGIGSTWPGGANALGQVDFTPLAGRLVWLWPDNDPVGFETMQQAAQTLRKLNAQVWFILPPTAAPSKWDAADREWESPAQLLNWMNARRHAQLPDFTAERITQRFAA